MSPTLSFSGWQKLLVPQGERIQHRGRALCLSLNSDPSEQLGKRFGRSWTMSQPVSNLQKPGYSLLFYTIHQQPIHDQEEILSLGENIKTTEQGQLWKQPVSDLVDLSDGNAVVLRDVVISGGVGAVPALILGSHRTIPVELSLKSLKGCC